MTTMEQMQAEIAKLKAENEALTKANERKLTLKVSEKGALSLVGMGRFPTTLYASQWERVIAMAPQIAAFIKANDKLLSRKS